jgi:hypothetical protein
LLVAQKLQEQKGNTQEEVIGKEEEDL